MNGQTSHKFNIVEATSTEHIVAAKKIFLEYQKWLGLDLCFQGFTAELASLPGKYVSPEGRLYLVYCDGKLAGCIALRKLSDGICEMKRLFVRDKFRGQGIGVELIRNIIAEARDIGYRTMSLDTFPPKMGKAVSLYESLGFRQIEPYYDNPHDEAIFMELIL